MIPLAPPGAARVGQDGGLTRPVQGTRAPGRAGLFRWLHREPGRTGLARPAKTVNPYQFYTLAAARAAPARTLRHRATLMGAALGGLYGSPKSKTWKTKPKSISIHRGNRWRLAGRGVTLLNILVWITPITGTIPSTLGALRLLAAKRRLVGLAARGWAAAWPVSGRSASSRPAGPPGRGGPVPPRAASWRGAGARGVGGAKGPY